MLNKYLLNEPDHSDEETPLFFWIIGLWLLGLTNLWHQFISFSPTGFSRIPEAVLTKGGQEDPSILASTSGLKGTNQNFHHIPSGTHWWCQHLKRPAWAICHHVDSYRPLWKMVCLNQPEWPVYMCRQPWSLFLNSTCCADCNVVPIMLLFSFRSKISFGKLEISEIISYLFFPLTFQKSGS